MPSEVPSLAVVTWPTKDTAFPWALQVEMSKVTPLKPGSPLSWMPCVDVVPDEASEGDVLTGLAPVLHVQLASAGRYGLQLLALLSQPRTQDAVPEPGFDAQTPVSVAHTGTG